MDISFLNWHVLKIFSIGMKKFHQALDFMYLSPEVVDGYPITEVVEVFSYVTVLYSIDTGHHLFSSICTHIESL
jgi:hypothetical protein